MILILILLLMAAALVAVLGVVSNTGSGHAVDGDFSIAGLHLSNLSTGQLFLYGVVIGVVGTLALSMLLGIVYRRLAVRKSQRRLESSQHTSDALRDDNERLNQQLDDERAENSQAAPIVGTRPAVDSGNGRTETVESVEQHGEQFDEPATDEVPDEPEVPEATDEVPDEPEVPEATDEVPDEPEVPERPGPRALIGHREERQP